jgi:hypothetical protein
MTMLKQYLYRYQGYIGAYVVVGGVDTTGAHLFTVHAHGSTDKLPFVTMGSGSMAAMAVFESGFKENMKVRGSSSFRTETLGQRRRQAKFNQPFECSERKLSSWCLERFDPVSSTIWDLVPTSTYASSPRTRPTCFETLRHRYVTADPYLLLLTSPTTS